MQAELSEAHRLLQRAWMRPLSPEKHKDKAQYLILHGVRLFHRQGVNGTGLNELLEAAQMGKSQFYHYFPNKEEFVCAVLRYEMDFFLTRVARTIRRFGSLQQLDEWFTPYQALGELPRNLGCPVGVIASEMSASSEAVRQAAAECIQNWLAALTEGLSYLQSKEPLSSDFNPRTCAECLAGSIQGALLLGRTMRSNQFILHAREQLRHTLQSYKISASASVT